MDDELSEVATKIHSFFFQMSLLWGPLKPKMTFKRTDTPSEVEAVMTDSVTLTALHSVTYHWTPHGFSVHGRAAAG